MLTSKEIEHVCAYCARITSEDEEQNIGICLKRGPVPLNHCCRSFKYDPLKRVPPKQLKLDDNDDLDLSL